MKKAFRIILLLIFTFLLVSCTSGKINKEEDITDQKEEILMDIQQEDDKMIVKTMYGDLEYPYAFSELIKVSENSTNNNQIIFNFVVENMSITLYEINFGLNRGIKIGKIAATDVFVNVINSEVVIADNYRTSFYAAQETVNDVIASISQWENFIPVE